MNWQYLPYFSSQIMFYIRLCRKDLLCIYQNGCSVGKTIRRDTASLRKLSSSEVSLHLSLKRNRGSSYSSIVDRNDQGDRIVQPQIVSSPGVNQKAQPHAAMLYTCDGMFQWRCDALKLHVMCSDRKFNMLNILPLILEKLSQVFVI